MQHHTISLVTDKIRKDVRADRTRHHLVLQQHTLLFVFINKAWLGLARQIAWALLGSTRFETLLHGTVRTCPHTLACLRLGLSPFDKFDKLNLMMIGLGWIIYLNQLLYYFCGWVLRLLKSAFPLPESPKAFRYKGGLSSLPPLLCLVVIELSSAFDSFGCF